MLTNAEIQAGRVGVVDFSSVSSLAKDFSSLIRIANNMEGAGALSEEFSHLLIGIFREEPLVIRTIEVLANNENALENILKNEY
jgi:hypothetical protein